MLARLLGPLCLGLILATPAAAVPARSAFRSSLDASIHGSRPDPSRSWSSRVPTARPARLPSMRTRR